MATAKRNCCLVLADFAQLKATLTPNTRKLFVPRSLVYLQTDVAAQSTFAEGFFESLLNLFWAQIFDVSTDAPGMPEGIFDLS